MIRTCRLTVSAANTFGMVRRLMNIDSHLADLCADAAVRTFFFINTESVQRDLIKQRIDRTEGTDVLAERAVDHDGQYHRRGKD